MARSDSEFYGDKPPREDRRRVHRTERREVKKTLDGYGAEADDATDEHLGEAVPIGVCQTCGVPVYTAIGFCSGCHPEKV